MISSGNKTIDITQGSTQDLIFKIEKDKHDMVENETMKYNAQANTVREQD